MASTYYTKFIAQFTLSARKLNFKLCYWSTELRHLWFMHGTFKG